MEGTRKVLAVVIGVIILILVVLVAKWVGEQIRQRFLTPKPPVSAPAPQVPEIPEETTPLLPTPPMATISAIPRTGPEDAGYLIIGFLFLVGVSALALDRKFS